MGTNRNRIFIECLDEAYGIDEGIASEAIDFGMAVEEGGSDDFQKQSTGDGNDELLLAIPKPYTDKQVLDTQGNSDGQIASAEQGAFKRPITGELVYVWLATGNNVSEDDLLSLDGGGGFQKYTGTTKTLSGGGLTTSISLTIQEDRVAKLKAIEALNNTSGDYQRIEARVL